MVSLSDLGGRILVSFQYLRDDMAYGHYMGFPLTTYLRTLLPTYNTKRAAAARRVRESAPGSDNGGANGNFNLGSGRGGEGDGTPGKHHILANGAPDPNP